MDIFFANTEPSLRFHRSHERLNISIKVQMIGLGLLADEIDRDCTTSELSEKLYRREGWLWGGMPDWSNPKKVVVAARRDIGQAGVVRAFSAFDLFMDETAADLTRWSAFSGDSQWVCRADAGEPDRAARFYQTISGTPAAVEFLWPVYRYFRFVRDCIVHRDGVASAAVEGASNDPQLADALTAWIDRTGDMTAPQIVPVQAGALIDLNHRHAISASSVLRLIVLDINRQALRLLGVQGLVYLAAHRTFLDEEPLDSAGSFRSMLHVLNWVLSDRYRVRGVSGVATSRVLRELGLMEECAQKYSQLRRIGKINHTVGALVRRRKAKSDRR